MKTNYSILIATSVFMLCSAGASAQWVKTPFPTSMPNRAFATSDGRILVGEYGKYYSGTGGGLYILSENGEVCEKADVQDYQFTSFAEDDNYIYAFGEGANIARTTDYETWEMISFSDIYDTSEIGDCYAAEIYNGRIYCAPFGLPPAYSENNGEKWILTDQSGLDPTGSGYSYLYGMKEFKGRLYAYGVDGIFRLNEDGETWEMLQQTYYASQSMIFNDKLYITNDVMAGQTCMWETSDGDNWTPVEIPAEYTSQNSLGSLCSIGNTFFIGSNVGIFYSNDNLNTWNNITLDYPVEFEFGNGDKFYVKPTCMVAIDNTLFAAGFNLQNKGGVFKIDASEYVSVSETTDNSAVKIADNRLTVSGTDNAQITVTSVDGKVMMQENGTEVQLENMPEGLYIYNVTTEGKKYSGKFINK